MSHFPYRRKPIPVSITVDITSQCNKCTNTLLTILGKLSNVEL